jgi:hypothetical protein
MVFSKNKLSHKKLASLKSTFIQTTLYGDNDCAVWYLSYDYLSNNNIVSAINKYQTKCCMQKTVVKNAFGK